MAADSLGKGVEGFPLAQRTPDQDLNSDERSKLANPKSPESTHPQSKERSLKPAPVLDSTEGISLSKLPTTTSGGVPTAQEAQFAVLFKLNLQRCQHAITVAKAGPQSDKQSVKWIMRELSHMKTYDPATINFSIEPMSDNIYNWVGTLFGPSDTPYEGGIFFLRIQYPENYPFASPKIWFVTKIYHPNVDAAGRICPKDPGFGWSPVSSVRALLLAMSSLLAAPKTDAPVAPEIARLYLDDQGRYDATARWYTKTYATGERPPERELWAVDLYDPPGSR